MDKNIYALTRYMLPNNFTQITKYIYKIKINKS